MPKSQKKTKKPKQTKSRKRTQEVKTSYHPISLGSTVRKNRPVFSGGVDRITVSHKELIASIASTGTSWARRSTFDFNPGSIDFPWLANVAWSWESFTFKSLRFIYEPRCATTTGGAIQVLADYDYNDDYPTTEQAASSMQGFVEAPPYDRCVFTVDVKAMAQSKKMKYVVPPEGVPNGADHTNYYAGWMAVYTVGTPADTVLGSLWIEYVVDLFIPSFGLAESLALGQTASGVYNNPDGPVPITTPFAGPGTADLSTTEFWNGWYPPYLSVGPGITRLSDGSLRFQGPATYSLMFNFSLGGSGGTAFWDTIPSFSDIITAGGAGVTYVSEIVHEADSIVAAVGGVFAVTGAFGTLQLAVPGWQVSFGAGSVTLVQNFMSFLASYVGPIANILAPQLEASEKERKAQKKIETKEKQDITPEDRALLRTVRAAYSARSESMASSSTSSRTNPPVNKLEDAASRKK